MNLQQINAFRTEHGLKPLAANAMKQAQHKRQEANRAARGQASRDLKNKRAKNGK